MGKLVLRQGRHIAGHHVNVLAIRTEHQTVWAVLAAGAQGHDVFVFIKLIITIGIGETMAAGGAAAVYVYPERAVGVEQALSAGDSDVEFLHLDLIAARVDAVQAFVALITGDQATFVIGANGHPRALLALGHGVEQLGLEAFGHLDRATISGGITAAGRAGKHIAPRAVAHLAGGDGLTPVGSLAGFPLAEKGAGRLPGGVGDERGFLALHGHLELRDKAGDAALVAALHGDHIGPVGEQFGDILEILVAPLVTGEGGLAVDVGGEAVVAGGDQLGFLDLAGGQVEGFAEIDGLVFLRPIRPDPLRSLCGSQHGSQRQKGKQNTFHHQVVRGKTGPADGPGQGFLPLEFPRISCRVRTRDRYGWHFDDSRFRGVFWPVAGRDGDWLVGGPP